MPSAIQFLRHMDHKQNFHNLRHEPKQAEDPKRHPMRHRQLVQLRWWVVASVPLTVVCRASYNKIHETNPAMEVKTSEQNRMSLWNTDGLRTSGIVSSSPSPFSHHTGDRSDKTRL